MLAAVSLPYFAFAQNAAQLTFRVPASELLRRTSSFVMNKRPMDAVSVKLPGHLIIRP